MFANAKKNAVGIPREFEKEIPGFRKRAKGFFTFSAKGKRCWGCFDDSTKGKFLNQIEKDGLSEARISVKRKVGAVTRILIFQ